jgi:hypothetical protein
MATFYEIYQNYLQNPYGGVNALPGVNPSSGIMNTNTISPIGGDSMGSKLLIYLLMLVSQCIWIMGYYAKLLLGLSASLCYAEAGLALIMGTNLQCLVYQNSKA